MTTPAPDEPWEDPPDDLYRQPWGEDPAAADHLLRPAWEDDPDASPGWPPPGRAGPWDARPDAPALPRRSRPAGSRPPGDAAALLAPLAAAQESLARLDARAETAPAPVRAGLIARLALREAAGWLAAENAWVHPHDLALRAENLAGRFDTAAQTGRARERLPSTFSAMPGSWDDPADLAGLAQAEANVIRALALARLLTALPRKHDPFADPDAAARFLGPLGAGEIDPDRFAAWRAAHQPARAGQHAPALPPLLQAADAALGWMESGATDAPDAIVALAIAALRLTRSETLKTIPLPFWAAWPVLGHPVTEGLPRLRPAAAEKLSGAGRAPWRAVFLALAAEAARAGLRELDRLQAAAGAGKALAEGLDRRARLPAAVDLVLAAPVVTPRGLAQRLGITLQAANRNLATLEKGGVVKEVTGRGSFRAYAV